MKIHGIAFLIFFCISPVVQSGVYKHVDEHGNTTYSNIPLKDAKAVDLPSITVVPAIDSEKIDSIIKRRKESARDKKQRDAVEQRIDEETYRLEELKNEYKDGTPDRLGSEVPNYQRYLDRVERLKGEISTREKNLEKLKQDLHDLPNTK